MRRNILLAIPALGVCLLDVCGIQGSASAQLLDLQISIDDGQSVELGSSQLDLSGVLEDDGSVRVFGDADFESTPASRSLWALDLLVAASGWRWVAPQAPGTGIVPVLTGTMTLQFPDLSQFNLDYTLDTAQLVGTVDVYLQGINTNLMPNPVDPFWTEVAMNTQTDAQGNVSSEGCILLDGELFANFTGLASTNPSQDLSSLPAVQLRLGMLQDVFADPTHSDRDGRAFMFNGKPFTLDIQVDEGNGGFNVATGSFEVSAQPHASDWSLNGQIIVTQGSYADMLAIFNMGWPAVVGRTLHSNVPWSVEPNELQGFQTLDFAGLGTIELSLFLDCQQQYALVEYDITNFDDQSLIPPPDGSVYPLRQSETFGSNAVGSFPGAGDIENFGLILADVTGTYFPLNPTPDTVNLPAIQIELDLENEVSGQGTTLEFNGLGTEDVEGLVMLSGSMDLGGSSLGLTGSMLSVPEKGQENSSRYSVTAQLNFDAPLPERGLVTTQLPALAQWLRRNAGINEYPPQASHVGNTHVALAYETAGWATADIVADEDEQKLDISSYVANLDWGLIADFEPKQWMRLTESEESNEREVSCITLCQEDPETGEEYCQATCHVRYAADTQSLPKALPTFESQLADFILCLQFSNNDQTIDIVARYELVASTQQVAAPSPGSIAALRAPYPNPMGARTSAMLSLPSPTRVEASIFDLRGRRIRAVFTGSLPTGEHAIHWDGRDERGDRVSAGVYFLKAAVGSELFSRKLIVIR